MIMVLGWTLFVVWIITLIARVVFRVVGSVFRGVGILPARRKAAVKLTLMCTNYRCNAPNPREARFCRRCGTPMGLIAGPGAAQGAAQPAHPRIAAYV